MSGNTTFEKSFINVSKIDEGGIKMEIIVVSDFDYLRLANDDTYQNERNQYISNNGDIAIISFPTFNMTKYEDKFGKIIVTKLNP